MGSSAHRAALVGAVRRGESGHRPLRSPEVQHCQWKLKLAKSMPGAAKPWCARL